MFTFIKIKHLMTNFKICQNLWKGPFKLKSDTKGIWKYMNRALGQRALMHLRIVSYQSSLCGLHMDIWDDILRTCMKPRILRARIILSAPLYWHHIPSRFGSRSSQVPCTGSSSVVCSTGDAGVRAGLSVSLAAVNSYTRSWRKSIWPRNFRLSFWTCSNAQSIKLTVWCCRSRWKRKKTTKYTD